MPTASASAQDTCLLDALGQTPTPGVMPETAETLTLRLRALCAANAITTDDANIAQAVSRYLAEQPVLVVQGVVPATLPETTVEDSDRPVLAHAEWKTLTTTMIAHLKSRRAMVAGFWIGGLLFGPLLGVVIHLLGKFSDTTSVIVALLFTFGYPALFHGFLRHRMPFWRVGDDLAAEWGPSGNDKPTLEVALDFLEKNEPAK